MSDEQIARTISRQAVETGAAETAVHGERRGDELPAILTTREGRDGSGRASSPSNAAPSGPSRRRARDQGGC